MERLRTPDARAAPARLRPVDPAPRARRTPNTPPPVRWKIRLLAGVVGFAVVLLFAECFLRFEPPRPLHPFLGDDSPISGTLSAHPDFGVGFADWEALRRDNPRSLSATSRDAWLFLGSSFAFDLAAEVGRGRPGQPVMTLDRREPLPVRFAQVERLLEEGRPAHVFLVVVPIDLLHLGEFGLDAHRVNARGGLVLEPSLPPGLAGSRLALTAWCRFGLHKADRSFRVKHLARRVPDRLDADLDRLLGALGRVVRRHKIPVTVVPIPARAAVLDLLSFALEERLAYHCAIHGVAYLDLCGRFVGHANPAGLYVADGHLSPEGNRLVAEEVARLASGGRP